jgi:hypothetical protein
MAKNSKTEKKTQASAVAPELERSAKKDIEPETEEVAQAQVEAKIDAPEQAPSVTTGPTEQVKEPEASADEIQVQVEVQTIDPAKPLIIQMMTDLRIEYPLPGRRDVTMRMHLKEGQVITDKHLIQHLMKAKEVPFIVKE